MQHLNIGILQYDIIWENAPANLALLDTLLPENLQVDVLILPEMFNTGFSMEPARIAETMDGPTVQWLQVTSERLKTVIMASVAIHENGKYYNRCIVVDRGSLIAQYDKRNLFTLTGEEKVYTPGHQNITFSVNNWKIKPLICYDLRFPQWCYNREDADLLVFMANWPQRRISHWDLLLPARAVENQAFVVGVNRVGTDGHGIFHSGHSTVINPVGEIILLPTDNIGLQTITIDRSDITSFRGLIGSLSEGKML